MPSDPILVGGCAPACPTVVARGAARLRGLIGRRSWPAGVALEIPRCRSVHTFGVRFALDLVWLDGERRVVRVDRAVAPWRIRFCRRARSVLELRTSRPLGTVKRAR
jgi:uncharacterized membrane protein (UPF0127 family)